MLTASEALNAYFLETRCQLLEIAATLDRLDRAALAGGEPLADTRLDRLYGALAVLAERPTASAGRASSDRAERLLNLFSDLD